MLKRNFILIALIVLVGVVSVFFDNETIDEEILPSNQKIDLSNMNLKDFLLKIIDNQYYKKDILSINLIFAFLQMYFIKKINNLDNYSVYTKFVNSIDDIKRFNLDIESLFIRLRHQIIND